MRNSLAIDIDASQLSSMAREIGATEKQMVAAMKSTYAKMGRWMRGRSVKGLSAELGIQQKILRRRIRAFHMGGGVSGDGFGAKVWYGLNPIPARDLKPRKTSNGVRVGGQEFEGAFLARRFGRMDVVRRVGRKRLPIESVTVDVNEKGIVWIEDTVVGSPEFERQFYKFFEHELKWRTR